MSKLQTSSVDGNPISTRYIHLPGKASDPNMNRCRFCTNMQDMDNGEGGMECKLPQDQRDKNRKCFSALDEIS